MNHLIRYNLIDRCKQYGWRSSISQLLRASIKKIYLCNKDIVFIIPNFLGYEFKDNTIRTMDSDRIDQADKQGALNPTQVSLLKQFISCGCKGIYKQINGKMAGYAWVQFTGEYSFGTSGKMLIPDGFAVMKNLYVFPEFRGRGIGQELNAARLSLVPAGICPVGFIIPENKYAIRNWEKYGFTRVASIRLSRWLFGTWKLKIVKLNNECDRTDTLLAAISVSDGE